MRLEAETGESLARLGADVTRAARGRHPTLGWIARPERRARVRGGAALTECLVAGTLTDCGLLGGLMRLSNRLDKCTTYGGSGEILQPGVSLSLLTALC